MMTQRIQRWRLRKARRDQQRKQAAARQDRARRQEATLLVMASANQAVQHIR